MRGMKERMLRPMEVGIVEFLPMVELILTEQVIIWASPHSAASNPEKPSGYFIEGGFYGITRSTGRAVSINAR